jgi:hypothetical protein
MKTNRLLMAAMLAMLVTMNVPVAGAQGNPNIPGGG